MSLIQSNAGCTSENGLNELVEMTLFSARTASMSLINRHFLVSHEVSLRLIISHTKINC